MPGTRFEQQSVASGSVVAALDVVAVSPSAPLVVSCGGDGGSECPLSLETSDGMSLWVMSLPHWMLWATMGVQHDKEGFTCPGYVKNGV
jgi:hypothetical protein